MPAPCIDESDRVSVARTHPGAPGGGVALRILNPDGSEGEKWALGLSALPLAVAAHGLAVAFVPASGQESVQMIPSSVESFLGPQTRIVLDSPKEFIRRLDLTWIGRYRGSDRLKLPAPPDHAREGRTEVPVPCATGTPIVIVPGLPGDVARRSLKTPASARPQQALPMSSRRSFGSTRIHYSLSRRNRITARPQRERNFSLSASVAAAPVESQQRFAARSTVRARCYAGWTKMTGLAGLLGHRTYG